MFAPVEGSCNEENLVGRIAAEIAEEWVLYDDEWFATDSCVSVCPRAATRFLVGGIKGPYGPPNHVLFSFWHATGV